MKVTGQSPLPTNSGMTDRNIVRMSVTGRSVWRMLTGLTMMLVSGFARFETAPQHHTDKDCIYEYFSRNKSGFFSTPSYPNHYPSNTTCLYSFYGQESERVRITFAQIDLNYPIGDPTHPDNCNDVDTVTIRTLPLAVDQKSSIISVYCGSKKPPKVMSSSNQLLVTFRSNIDSTSTGFLAQYEFIRDFGIKSGEQDFESECRFVYRSSKAFNGSFHSPNYPGLYPKNTECQYVFHGRPGERVEIIFRYFEVEGIPPTCSEDSDSDYVEFTNSLSEFNSRSGQRHEESTGASTRYCVTKADHSRKTFASDGNFFRVTFKSNSVYDANGFDAVYQFVTHPQELGLGSSSSSFHCIRQERCVITILTHILVIFITICVLQIRHSEQ